MLRGSGGGRIGLPDLANKNTREYCTGHTYTKTLLVIYLKFKCMRLPVFSLAILVETSPLKGVGLPGVNQSEAGPHSGERDWEAGPRYQGRSSWLCFLGVSGLWPAWR